MTAKQLLSSNSYIQYPKFLGFYIGVNEAVLLSALCDKDSWCEFNIENYDGWFYFLREEIYFETGLTERQQRSAILKLEDLNILGTKRQGLPAKVYYFINTDALELVLNHAYELYKAHKTQMLQNVTSCPNKTVTTCTSENVISTINKNINIKINKKGTGAGASSKNHSQVYKQKQTLSDDLESGKDIDEQKKYKKQSPKDKFRDECLDIIEKQFVMYPAHISDLLADYFDFISAVPDDKENLPKRVKTVSAWKKKLHKLVELVAEGYDIEKLIQQSLDNKAYVFYPLQSSSTTTKHELGNDLMMSDTEWAIQTIQKAEDNDEELF